MADSGQGLFLARSSSWNDLPAAWCASSVQLRLGCTPSFTRTARLWVVRICWRSMICPLAATLQPAGTSSATMRSNSPTSPCPSGSGRPSTAV